MYDNIDTNDISSKKYKDGHVWVFIKNRHVWVFKQMTCFGTVLQLRHVLQFSNVMQTRLGESYTFLSVAYILMLCKKILHPGKWDLVYSASLKALYSPSENSINWLLILPIYTLFCMADFIWMETNCNTC